MIRYEIKKIFSKTMNKAALLVMAAILVIVCLFTLNSVYCTDESGDHLSGIAAAKKLREMQEPWSGHLTEDVFAEVIRKNAQINGSEEALSDDILKQNQAYAKKQGFGDILNLLNDMFSPYRDWDPFMANRLTEEDAKYVYEKRISGLKEFLDSGEEYFSENEKAFLVERYEALKIHFY